MEKEFVPYDIALAMKELGFDEPCFGRYWNGDLRIVQVDNQVLNPTHVCLAPLYQQAFRWLREKYNLWGKAGFRDEFYTGHSNSDYTEISEIRHESNPNMTAEDTTNFIRREENECLKTIIEVVKSKM